MRFDPKRPEHRDDENCLILTVAITSGKNHRRRMRFHAGYKSLIVLLIAHARQRIAINTPDLLPHARGPLGDLLELLRKLRGHLEDVVCQAAPPR